MDTGLLKKEIQSLLKEREVYLQQIAELRAELEKLKEPQSQEDRSDGHGWND